MKKFKYTATDKNGKKIKGNFVAENETEMKEMLLKSGYYVTSVRQVSSQDFSQFLSLSGRVRVSELSNFCNQFSVMITAGISIVDAIDVSLSQSYSPTLKKALRKISEDLKQGLLLSEAMAKQPKIFPPFFSSMVYVGESSGCLDKVLINVAEYYEMEEKTKKKISGALAYPLILVAMMIGILVVLFVFVIPAFMDSFTKLGTTMPALTMAIFNVSLFMQQNWMYILAFAAVLAIVLWGLHFLPTVKMFYHRMAVTLPIFKKINMNTFTSRFCRSLGLLLSSGADSLDALISLRKTITNVYLAKQFDKVIDDVKMGMSLSSALTAEMKLSPILIQMIVVGEKTGDLDKVLNRTAPYFDRQTENSLNLLTTLLQPSIMIFLGAVVAVLFMAIYSPILEMVKQTRV